MKMTHVSRLHMAAKRGKLVWRTNLKANKGLGWCFYG